MSDLRMAAQQALEALETCDAAHPSDGGRQWYDDKAVSDAITALRAALSQPDVAQGWVLVPVEPTPEMLKAAVVYANGNAVYKNVAAEALRIEESIYGEVYAAMLAAAPKGTTI